MPEAANWRRGAQHLPWLLLGCLAIVLPAVAVSAPRHGILATGHPRRGSFHVGNGAHCSRALALVSPSAAVTKPVSVVVYTFWGEGSCFNTQLRLDCAMTDSGLSIKRQIAAATGVPVGLQRLFVSESIWTLGTRTPLGDGDRVSEFHSLMRLRHDTHDLELNVLLELPAPLHHNMRAEAERLDEYVSVLRRYSALLGRVKAAREDPRLLLDPGDSDVGDLRGCDSDSVGTLGDAAGGGMTADGSPGTLGSHGKDGAEDPAKASHVPANTNRHGSETGRKAADNQSGNFVLPNRRRHLLFFHDLPPSEGGAGVRLREWLDRQLPVDWATTAKFALMCYLTRATCNNERWVNTLLLYAPPICLLCQTRPGRVLSRSLFHMLPTKAVPKGELDGSGIQHYAVVTNVLPAHVAQQLE